MYALTGGLAPLMPAIDSSQLKKQPPKDEKVNFSVGFGSYVEDNVLG